MTAPPHQSHHSPDPDRPPNRSPKPAGTPAPGRPPILPPWLPGVGAVLGVLLLAVTVRGAGGLNHGPADGPGAGWRPPLAIATFILLVMLAASYAKHRDDDGYGVLRRAGSACAVLLGVSALLVPLGLFMFGARRPPAAPLPEPTDGPTGPQTVRGTPVDSPTAQPAGRSHPAHWLTTAATIAAWLLAAALVAFVVVVVVQLVRRRNLSWTVEPGLAVGDLADAEELAEAVAAASRALEYQGDAREAVIFCYAAMEARIGEVGVGRQAADTPEELLTRAISAGLVPADAATRLTELFRRARFSQHPVTETHRADARRALTRISEHLKRVRAEHAAGAAAKAEARTGGVSA